MTPLTAKEPLIIIKELKEQLDGECKYVTPYQGAEVKFVNGKCKLGDGVMDGDAIGLGHGGFVKNHIVWENGKFNENDFESLSDRCRRVLEVRVYRGIHAYYGYPRGSVTGYVFKTGVIPPGAHYFVGNCLEIVSDEMIIYENDIELLNDYPDAKNFFA